MPIAKLPDLQWLRIPRRPKLAGINSPKELHTAEETSFLGWRRELARLEDSGHFILTPFERNLDIWRQLWRVVESCGLLVQIVDARNPLVFYCEDLTTYIKEIGPEKHVVLLINKADYLSDTQRLAWKEYFDSKEVKFVFYSAKLAVENSDKDEIPDSVVHSESNSSPIRSKQDILELLLRESQGRKVGFIGYPNVGKSTTINSLAGVKRVAVAPTPGKTKHFQTINLDNGVVLYDCPGLVFPNFAASKGELVLNGVLPVDQLREWISPCSLLLERVPKDIIERTYGFRLPAISAEEDPNRLPTASELLSSFATARGFKTSFHGNPDESRAARIILKDYVNGKLLHCVPPPGSLSPAEFNSPYYDEYRKRNPLRSSPQATALSYSVVDDLNFSMPAGPSAQIKAANGSFAARNMETLQGRLDKKHYKMNKRK